MFVEFSAKVRPSSMMKSLMKHQGDVSEGDRAKLIAVRTIAGRRVEFYSSGEHVVDADITASQMYDSEVLRFAHASLIVNEPVGDKRKCYVDATVDPCEVWVYGQPLREFVGIAKQAMASGTVATDLVIDGDPRPQFEEILR